MLGCAVGFDMLSLLIPTEVLASVQKVLGRLAKRAGVEVTPVPGTSYRSPLRDTTRLVACGRITVGAMPRINGWAFVARLEHTAEGVVTACAPGESLPPAYREAKPVCEHCGTARRRAETFVLRAPTGELSQIGRNCLAEFLACDASRLVHAAELALWLAQHAVDAEFDPEDDGIGGSWFGRGDIRIEWFVACAVASIAQYGYHKSGTDQPTRADASWRANPPFGACARERELWRAAQPTEEQRARAAQIVAWAQALAGDLSDYEHNLRIAARLPVVGKHAGVLASLPVAYERAMGIELDKKAAPRKVSEFWGELGKRSEVTVTLVKLVEIDSRWANPTLCIFVTADGAKLIWFASGSCPRDIGAEYKVKGTVKKHEEYKGVKQTVITRVKWEVATSGQAVQPEQRQG